MTLPTVLKKLIKEFMGYDFQREYMLACIRMIGRENAKSEFKYYTDPSEFIEIKDDLQRFGVDLQTIHGGAFVSKQQCNEIIRWRGNTHNVVVKNIFETIMNIPNQTKVCLHQGKIMACILRCAAAGTGMDLSHWENFDWVLNRKIETFKQVYGLLS